jgi:hypothetical protein
VHTLSGVAGPGQRGASKTFRDLPQTIDCVYDGFGVGLNYIVASPVLVSFGTAVQRAAVDIAADQVVRTTVRGTSDARLVTGEDQGSSFAELVAQQGHTLYIAGATSSSSARSRRMAQSLIGSLITAAEAT